MLIHESVDFFFPSEHLLVRIDPHRTMSLRSLREAVKKYLKRHRTFAEESKWNEYRDKRSDDGFIYVDGLEMAAEALHDFRLVRYWPRLTKETDSTTIVMLCFCHLGFKFCFCHHCWVMQILLSRSKAFIISYEPQSVIEVEDIPMRKAHRKFQRIGILLA